MKKYLYGASVQGIQQFIFQTNELKDIVGASELVEHICTQLFKETVGDKWNDDNCIISAAGNVKYIFDDKADCEKVVLNFPKEVMTQAPGITISQAVVEIENDFMQAVNELDKKLHAQRNKVAKSITTGRLGLKRSPQTGLPVVKEEDGELLDASSVAKKSYNRTKALCEKNFGEAVKSNSISHDVSMMTGKNDWIAVIHADGNGLGKVVRKIGSNQDDFKQFSHELDKATRAAANDAFRAIKPEGGWKGIIPIRPIVLGGDDMTVIIRGDLAIAYVTEFMKQFELHTGEGEMKRILEKADMPQLTACAGVAFIKSSYPFYYGYQLAEQLCEAAKKDAKAHNEQLAPSCLMFHKVQDSFVMKYEEIVERELEIVYRETEEDAKNNRKNSFCFGPYYLNDKQLPEGYYTIDELNTISKEITGEETEGIRTGIRRWLTLMHEDEGKAEQRLKRLKTLNESKHKLIEKLTYHRTVDGKEKQKTFPAYDILAYHTIMNQQTK
ncbi:Cas10/Cmr2 second palm domain-containing protein [Prevotella falsenii]|uniref:Cas10/Cmr2 second palm domain-containing protein n=1 Tax=Prevotella falsenii TaxID=515414 RepID=UPI00055A5E03|nr:hypothetical protein [Prevotella falsenii]